jgi:hypothetical protein
MKDSSKIRYVTFFDNWRTAYLIFFTPRYFLWFLYFAFEDACTFGDACILAFSNCEWFGFNFFRCFTVPREMSGSFAVKADFIVFVVISSFYVNCIWKASGHLGYRWECIISAQVTRSDVIASYLSISETCDRLRRRCGAAVKITDCRVTIRHNKLDAITSFVIQTITVRVALII